MSNEQRMMKLLLFDLLVCDAVNIMRKPLSSRYGKLKDWIVSPHKRFVEQQPRHMRQSMPFECVCHYLLQSVAKSLTWYV